MGYPKPDAERRRRNAPTFDWVHLPKAGRKGRPPALPTRKPTWHAGTRKWWADLWATPQATQWDETDAELYRLAMLHELTMYGSAGGALPALLAEMRQIEDRHGLNPKALLQLRWIIVDDGASVAPAPKKRSSADRRARLSAVT